MVDAASAERVLGKPLEREYALFDLLRRPEVGYDSLMTLPGAGEAVADRQVVEQVEIQAKYQGYIERQKDEVERKPQPGNPAAAGGPGLPGRCGASPSRCSKSSISTGRKPWARPPVCRA